MNAELSAGVVRRRDSSVNDRRSDTIGECQDHNIGINIGIYGERDQYEISLLSIPDHAGQDDDCKNERDRCPDASRDPGVGFIFALVRRRWDINTATTELLSRGMLTEAC